MSRASTNLDAPPKRLDCPRCGYDITPQMVASESRGEARGTCSECGLDIAWSEVRATGNDPRWFVESRTVPGRPRRRLARAAATLAMCARPFRFWSRVSMTVPTDRRGIVAFLVFIALVAHLCLAARNIHTLATQGRGWVLVTTPRGPGWVMKGSANPLDYIATTLVPLSNVSFTDVGVKIDKFTGEPPSALERSARIAVAILEDPGFWPPAWFRSAANPDIPWHQTPIRMSNQVILDDRALGRLACASVVPLSAPLAIMLLPISMRRARVRPRHLVRCVIYSVAMLIPLGALFFLTQNGFGTAAGIRASEMLEVHKLMLCAMPLTLVWNWAFVRGYLRLEHPIAVATSNTVLAVLLSLLATFLVFGWI